MIVMEKGKVAGAALKSIIQSRREDKIVSEAKATRYPEHCEGDIEVKNVSYNSSLGFIRTLMDIHEGIIFIS